MIWAFNFVCSKIKSYSGEGKWRNSLWLTLRSILDGLRGSAKKRGRKCPCLCPSKSDTGAETLTETVRECNTMSRAASALGAETPFADAIAQFQPYGGAVKPSALHLIVRCDKNEWPLQGKLHHGILNGSTGRYGPFATPSYHFAPGDCVTSVEPIVDEVPSKGRCRPLMPTGRIGVSRAAPNLIWALFRRRLRPPCPASNCFCCVFREIRAIRSSGAAMLKTRALAALWAIRSGQVLGRSGQRCFPSH